MSEGVRCAALPHPETQMGPLPAVLYPAADEERNKKKVSLGLLLVI